MDSYDHQRKAGNQGDVVKHVALVAAVDQVLSHRTKHRFTYADVYAGYAYNFLTPCGDWTSGIRLIHERRSRSSNPHVSLWQTFWDGDLPLAGGTYPGSAIFALRMALKKGRRIRLLLWDTSPSVAAQLRMAFDGFDADIRTTAAGSKAIAAETPNLALVDPPGVKSPNKPEYPSIEQLLDQAEAAPSSLLWLPMTARCEPGTPESKRSRSWREHGLSRGHAATTVRWARGGRFCGCQLLYRLPSPAVAAVRRAVAEVATHAGWDGPKVQHPSD